MKKRASAGVVFTAVSVAIAMVAGAALALEKRKSLPTGHEVSLPQTLLDSTTDVLGRAFQYPGGTPAKINSQIMTLRPGESTPWHSHAVPTFGHILQGEITVHYASGEVKTFAKGDSLIEAQNMPHMGVATGHSVVKILVVYAGAEGVANTKLES